MSELKKLNITLKYKVEDKEYDYKLCDGANIKLDFKKIRPNNVYRHYNDQYMKSYTDESKEAKDHIPEMNTFFTNNKFNLNLPSSSIYLPKLEDLNSILTNKQSNTDELTKKYLDHIWTLFIDKFGSEEQGDDLLKLFKKFQEEYLEAYERQADTIKDRYGWHMRRDEKRIPDYITKRKQKEIFKKYAKFFNEKIDDKELDFKFVTDPGYLKKVISYYNVYYLLTNIFLPKDTIIVDNFYGIGSSKDEHIEIRKYIKVKSIEPMLQLSHIKSITPKTISCYFQFTFEPISTYNKLRFNINVFDREKYSYKDKFDIINHNNKGPDTGLQKSQNYKDYTNEIFLTRNKKSSTELYFDDTLDLDKIGINYDKLRKFNAKVVEFKIKNVYEFFIFQFLFAMIDPTHNLEYKNAKNVPQQFYENLVHNIFFKLNSTIHLQKLNSKKPYAEIQKVKINKELTYNFNKRNKSTEELPADNDFVVIYPSDDLRLKIDKKDSRFNMYIDLHVLYKKTADAKIDMKTKIKTQLKCNYNANILDELFYRLLKYNYKKNFFVDGMASLANTDKDEVPPAETTLPTDPKDVKNTPGDEKPRDEKPRDDRYRDYRPGNFGFDEYRFDDDDMYWRTGGKKNNKRKLNTNKYSIPKNKGLNPNKKKGPKPKKPKIHKKQKYNSKKKRTFKNKKKSSSSSHTIKNLIKLYLKT